MGNALALYFQHGINKEDRIKKDGAGVQIGIGNSDITPPLLLVRGPSESLQSPFFLQTV